MAGEARNGHQPAFVAPFLLAIFDQEVHILAPSSSFKLPSGSLICCKLSIRDAAAAAAMRIAKTLGFAGQDAHVVLHMGNTYLKYVFSLNTLCI